MESGVGGVTLLLLIFWRLDSAGRQLFRIATDPFLKSLGLGFAALMLCAFIGNLFGDRWTFLQVSGYTWAVLGLVFRGTALTLEASADQDEQTALDPLGEPVAAT